MDVAEHFFVIGAQRSGTTYLYRLLDEHPEICMARPVRPEPKFFVDEEQYARGVAWYEQRYWPDPAGRLLGDKSVGYLESDAAARRIAAAYPGAKIVAMLRNPVERAVSHYGFSVDNGIETLPLEEALASDEERRAEMVDGWYVVGDHRIQANPFAYRRRSRYVLDLRRWSDRFAPEDLWVGVFESTVGSESAVAGLYRFLGVDDTFRPPTLAEVVNPGSRSGGAGDLEEGFRRRLEQEFEPWNAALAEEYGLDLSVWEPGGSGGR